MVVPGPDVLRLRNRCASRSVFLNRDPCPGAGHAVGTRQSKRVLILRITPDEVFFAHEA
jgi:hypothetical protein